MSHHHNPTRAETAADMEAFTEERSAREHREVACECAAPVPGPWCLKLSTCRRCGKPIRAA